MSTADQSGQPQPGAMSDAAMQTAPTPHDPKRAKRKNDLIVVCVGALLMALLALGTWKAMKQGSSVIKIDVALPALDIGTGRVHITHGAESSDWVVNGTTGSDIEMTIHRDEFIGTYSYEFHSTRPGALGGAVGRGNRGGAGGRGPAQTPAAITRVLSYASQLKLTPDQEALISAIDLEALPVAAVDPADQQAAIQKWLDLLAAPDEKGKGAAEWELVAILDNISTKTAPYTEYANAVLDANLCDGPSPILTAEQIPIYRKLEKQAATQPTTAPANARGGNRGAAGAGRGNGDAAPGNNRAGAANNRAGAPAAGNRAGAATPPAAGATAANPRAAAPPASATPAPRAAAPPASAPPASTPPVTAPPASAPPVVSPPASAPPASVPPAAVPPASTPPAAGASANP